jgi:hypothetical protein
MNIRVYRPLIQLIRLATYLLRLPEFYHALPRVLVKGAHQQFAFAADSKTTHPQELYGNLMSIVLEPKRHDHLAVTAEAPMG